MHGGDPFAFIAVFVSTCAGDEVEDHGVVNYGVEASFVSIGGSVYCVEARWAIPLVGYAVDGLGWCRVGMLSQDEVEIDDGVAYFSLSRSMGFKVVADGVGSDGNGIFESMAS